MTQENNKQEYMLPEDVDTRKQFKFHLEYDSDTYTCEPEGSGRCMVSWCDKSVSYRYEEVENLVRKGDWRVLKDVQEYPDGFKFEANGWKYRFCNEKIYFDGGGFCKHCSKEEAKELLLSGFWKLIPKEDSRPKQPTSTPKQFDEETFKDAEKAVKDALFPAVEPSLQEVLSEFHQKFGGQLDCIWRCGEDTCYTLKLNMFGEETRKKVLMAINGVKIGD